MATMKDGAGGNVQTSDIRGVTLPDKEKLKELVKAVKPEDRARVVGRHEATKISGEFFIRFSILEFIGYNPEVTIDTLIAMSRVYKDASEVLDLDIDSCLAIVLYMGNVQPKAFSRRADEGKAMVEYLSGKYNIQVGSTGNNMEPEVLTFPRIQSAFPVKAIRMSAERPPKAVSGEFRADRVPGYMRLHPFGSLCSATMGQDLQNFLVDACAAYSADMSIAYTKGALKKRKQPVVYDPIEIGLEQREFVIIASGSPVPSDETKKSLLLELNLAKDYENIALCCKQFRGVVNKVDPSDIVVMTKEAFETSLSNYLTGHAGTPLPRMPPRTSGGKATEEASTSGVYV